MIRLKYIALFALALAFVSCSKEEAIQPQTDLSTAVSTKNKTTGTPDTSTGGSGEPQHGLTTCNPAGGTGTTQTGISDDGDDLSDSEKSRKKRR